MTARRRPRSAAEAPGAAHPTASFTWGSIVNLAAIPAVTAFLIFVGSWFVTGDTLKRHETTLDQMKIERRADEEKMQRAASEEKTAREAVRNEFLTSQKQLVDVLGKLETRLSVGEKQQDTMSRQLDKLGDLIQRTALPPLPRQENR